MQALLDAGHVKVYLDGNELNANGTSSCVRSPVNTTAAPVTSTDAVEVRDFPARDIWFLGVILPGLDQIEFLGNRRRRRRRRQLVPNGPNMTKSDIS